jgi:hypothetical protein
MYRKIFLAILTALLAISLTACVIELENAESMLIGISKEYEESVYLSDRQDIESPIKLKLDMKMAKAVIGSTEDKLADVKFTYRPEALKPEFRVEGDEISIRNSFKGNIPGKTVNKWEVKLTEKFPIEVDLKADASDLKFDMGKIMVDGMNGEFNASSAKLYFDEIDKVQQGSFNIKGNASNIDIYGAGSYGAETLDKI